MRPLYRDFLADVATTPLLAAAVASSRTLAPATAITTTTTTAAPTAPIPPRTPSRASLYPVVSHAFFACTGPNASIAARDAMAETLKKYPAIANKLYVSAMRCRGYWDPYVYFLINNQLVDINLACPKTGNTALIYAASRAADSDNDANALAAVGFLIARGIGVNHCNATGDNALMWPAHQGNVAVCRQLIEAGINVTQANHNQITPVFAAIHANQPEILHLLFNHAGRAACLLMRPGASRYTALHYAAHLGRSTLLPMLLDDDTAQDGGSATPVDVNIRDARRTTPLMLAIDKKHEETAVQLAARGANIGAVRRSGTLDLIQTVICEQRNCALALRLLLASVEYRHKQSKIPLLVPAVADEQLYDGVIELFAWACDVNDRIIMRHLRGVMKDDFQLDSHTRHTRSLFFAASRGYDGTVDYCLRKLWQTQGAAGVALSTRDGMTALHYAVLGKHEFVCQVLFTWGADFFAENVAGHSPATLGFNQDTALAIRLFEQYYFQCQTVPLRAAARDKLSELRQSLTVEPSSAQVPMISPGQREKACAAIDAYFSRVRTLITTTTTTTTTQSTTSATTTTTTITAPTTASLEQPGTVPGAANLQATLFASSAAMPCAVAVSQFDEAIRTAQPCPGEQR